MYKACFVLGAGASLDMGYPLGDNLRKEIITKTTNTFTPLMHAVERQLNPQHPPMFVDAFKCSQMNSVDAFLARRPEFAEVGRMAIACVILSHENAQRLVEPREDDGWYRYFFNCISADTWDNLRLDQYCIVTFNYDRSLELYLASAMRATYGKPLAQCLKKVAELKIVHVYGCVAPTDSEEPRFFPYGDPLSAETLAISYKRIKVIPEGRDQDSSLVEARRLISESHTVAFLGFGYDLTNISRLGGGTDVFKDAIVTPDGHWMRSFYGTAIGLHPEEVDTAVNRILKGSGLASMFRKNWMDANCKNLLRKMQIFQQ